MWIARFVLLGLLAVYVGLSSHLLKHRDRYGRLLENGPVNLVLVLLYNLLCYLVVGLPSDQGALSPPAFLTHPAARTGLSIDRYFRHPIYTGIVWISLGLPLATQNLDGLLMFPGVLLANVAQATVEERWDVGARFQAEYEEYRKRTRMFGPAWFWAALIGILLALAGVPYLVQPG